MNIDKINVFAEACREYEAKYQCFKEAMRNLEVVKNNIKNRIAADKQSDIKRKSELESLLVANAVPAMRATWESELATLTNRKIEKTRAEVIMFEDAFKKATEALSAVRNAESKVTEMATATIDEVKTEKNRVFTVVPAIVTLRRNLDSAREEFIYKI